MITSKYVNSVGRAGRPSTERRSETSSGLMESNHCVFVILTYLDLKLLSRDGNLVSVIFFFFFFFKYSFG